jgi:hypothetical protein
MEDDVAERFRTVRAEGICLTLDLAVGHIRSLEIDGDGRRLSPFHTAPWIEDPAIIDDPDIPPGLKFLSVDFFCAPFGKSDIDAAPGHGWPANSPWRFLSEDRQGPATTARFRLEQPVMGARLIKAITLRDGHPFVYQEHVFEGGSGAVSIASHAMTRFTGEGHLAFSPKAFGELPTEQQETDPKRGRSLFATSARFSDLSKLPLANGRTVDLHRYPVAERHEDFVVLIEAQSSPLGWTAAVRPGAGDIVLSLKNPQDFPMTFLWFSNGGRDYPPWNGRHEGVLGIEEGRAYLAAGHAASVAPNPLSDAGIPTSITLKPDGSVSVRHVIGGVPLPPGWEEVASIEAHEDTIRLANNAGGTVEHKLDARFLTQAR